ncbi:MAG: N-acetylmuramoyl-L-alanine amidase [Deltaproteobacteria bacterium]|nr:MAG: N-acetylmuramoyl-L-alanine amidase [Deltaproteobacteria bacterium]
MTTKTLRYARDSKHIRTRGRDNGKIARIVLHITGRALWKKAHKHKISSLEMADLVYQSGIGPHYVIDEHGEILFVRDERIRPAAQGWGPHGGIEKVRKLSPPSWWKRYWNRVDFFLGYRPTDRHRPKEAFPRDYHGSFSHPVDLIAPDTTPNARSVAIEFVQCDNQRLLTRQQYIAGAVAVYELCDAYGLEISRRSVLSHEDVDPWRRGDRGGGWDVGALRILPTFSWEAILDISYLPQAYERGLVYDPGDKVVRGALL